MAFALVLCSSILFSIFLDWVASFRAAHSYLILGAPLLVFLLIKERKLSRFRLSSREEVQAVFESDRPSIVFLAGPMLIAQTVLVHFFGGSVGREGIGIQLGAWASRWSKAARWYRAGCIATGISVIFGAPLTGTAFLFETALIRKKSFGWKEILAVPSMSVLGDQAARFAGVKHFQFPKYIFSELSHLLNAESFVRVAGLILLVFVLSLVFLIISGWVSSHVNQLSERKLISVAAWFLVIFAVFGFLLGEESGLPGLGIQLWPSIFESGSLAAKSGAALFGLAVLKSVFTAGFTGLGFKGGEVTPLLAIGSLCGVLIGSMFDSPLAPIYSALGFSMLWGVTARRPLVAATLGFEYFGEAALIAGGLVWVSLKCGDLVVSRYEKVRGVWHHGLYD